MERFAPLVGSFGDLAARNRRLAEAIRAGELDGGDAALLAHLILTTVEKLSVDQPAYPAFARWKQNAGPRRG